jgi:hypothetical protein
MSSKKVIYGVLVLLPTLAFAQSNLTIIPFLHRVSDLILNPIILLLFSLSFVYFAYGVVRFLSTNAGDKSSTRVEARNSIMWGIIGMTIMFSVYGILNFVLATFGISGVNLRP